MDTATASVLTVKQRFLGRCLRAFLAITLAVGMVPSAFAFADTEQGEAASVDDGGFTDVEASESDDLSLELLESTELLETAPLRSDAVVRANLVLLVKFKGDTEGDLGTTGADAGFNGQYTYNGLRTRWEYLQARIDSDTRSQHQAPPFRYSIRTFSNGAYDVKSYFPQTNESDGTVNYIELDNEASYYVDKDDTMISEALEKFNKANPGFDASALDVDKDGFVDNLLLIPAVEASGTFTSHKSISDMKPSVGAGGGKQVSLYNIIEAHTEQNGLVMDTFKEGTAVHEYLHTLNARDYYRSSDTPGADVPVGIWDVMAVSVMHSWPLALTRQTAGWCSIPEVAAEGTYTLHTAAEVGSPEGQAADKKQAVIVKTPASASEYFVIEYRRKSSENFSFDSKIGGSGAIVYRVNERYAEEGNITSSGDYVYVFREGETGMANGRPNGAGDVTHAQVSTVAYAAGNRTAVGTTDMAKGLADGAICYSDGQNSGLVVEAIDQTDDSITIKVSHADWSGGEYWQETVDVSSGTVPFGAVHNPAVATATDGVNVYMVAEDQQEGRSRVWKYDTAAATWTQCGQELVGLSGVSLTWFGGSLFAVGSAEAAKTVQLRRFDGGSWVEVASTPATATRASYPGVTVSGDALYVLADSGGEHTKVYRFVGASLIQQGGEVLSGAAMNSVVFDLGGNPAVVLANTGSSQWETGVYSEVGGTWAKTATIGQSAASVLSVASSGDGAYAFAHQSTADGSKAYLATLGANGSLSAVEELAGEAASVAALSGSLATDGSHLYLSGANGSGAVAACAAPVSNPSQMAPFGSQVYRSGLGVSSVIASGTVYCAVADANGSSVAVRMRDALPGAVVPDPGPDPDPNPDPNPIPNPDPTPDPNPNPNPNPTPPPAQKAETELSGTTRIGTAIAIARTTYSSEKPKGIIVARSDNFPDALAASTLSGAQGYPILLNPTGWLDPEVRAYASGLRDSIREVILIGDANALSKTGVEAQLKKLLPSASVKRIGGVDRIQTAALIRSEAKRAGAAGRTAVIARSDNFPDALSISPYCAATGALLYLVKPGSSLDAQTVRELTGFDQVLIVGDSHAVSSKVEAALKAKAVKVKRLAGGVGNGYDKSRYGTSAAIADWVVKESGSGFGYSGVVFATGKNFPDALAGGPLCGKLRYPIVLVDAGAYSAVDAVAASGKPNALYWLGSAYTLSTSVRKNIKAILKY
ncbi:cell wall-binding repeat-containing protein [Raoultibacter phocaeensis]|uniref:cell wall-binding repeat-containing protein n=1 Tax=Raoultibacter phocaeensis TaxID=2479841 RepID=UPI00111AD5AF|nr:cell wall-binding repeat-containing protein [Raoultibacter phocaeensis]